MSKLSPYRKGTSNYLQDQSPLSPYYNENKTTDKRRRPAVEHTNKRYYEGEYPKLTEKKRYEQTGNINLEQLLEKNQALASENAELYTMLEERGRIIVALEQKLEQQVRSEMATLEAIEFEKGKFIADSHKKFKDYERKIQELINEIYLLNEEKEQGSYLNAQQIHSLRDTLTHEQLMHFQSVAHNQASARELADLERAKCKAMLDTKQNRLTELEMEFAATTEKMKAEIVSLNGEIVHLSHMRKMELSEQKILYEGMLDSKAKDHLKEKELLIMQNSLQVKKLENHLAALENKLALLGEQKKIGEVQQSTRELQLIENNNKLEIEVQEVQDFARRNTFEETQRLKQLNRNQIKTIEVSNEAIINNLKSENARLIALLHTKGQEIDRLLEEVAALRAQQAADSTAHEKLVEELRERMRGMERDALQEEERLKIKLAELREADIRALKEFYEHELEVLNQELFEKSNLASKNRSLLHQQLHAKNQMRKNFDIEILKLTSRLRELEHRLAQKQTEKREAVQSVSDKALMTSELLLRETKEKEKLAQVNEEEKRRLYELIETKDKEIEELNAKVALLSKNHLVELAQKLEQIDLLRKAKEDLEVQLKKEKYFYDNQLKKKDILLKNNADIYRNDIESLKNHQRSEMELNTRQSATKINALELELAKYRALQKNLKIEVTNLTQTKEVQIQSKSNQLELEKERLEGERRDTLQKLERHYQGEMGKQAVEINQLKRQLMYKQEDLRGMAEKYHRLEQKLAMVMESQEKLRAMESRIVALGQDNNLVKNFAEIIKTRNAK